MGMKAKMNESNEGNDILAEEETTEKYTMVP
jgi:hypothetical protein